MAGAAALVATSATVALAAPAPAGPDVIADAIVDQPGLLNGGVFLQIPSNVNAGISTDPLGGFPVAGSSYGVLSTGELSSIPVPGAHASTAFGPQVVGGANDVTTLGVDLDVPEGANCVAFDFKFLSDEYPSYVSDSSSDTFIAELDDITWSVNNYAVSAPGNFAFDTAGDLVSVATTGVTGMSASEGAGTAFDSGIGTPNGDPNGGATGLLTAGTPATPGVRTVWFTIFDMGDPGLDSAVFLDNLRAFNAANATDCANGVEFVPPVQTCDVVAPVVPGALDQTLAGHTGNKSSFFRFASKNRVLTALYSAQNTSCWGDTAILASSKDYSDALAAAPLAEILTAPILLANTDGSLDPR